MKKSIVLVFTLMAIIAGAQETKKKRLKEKADIMTK